MWSKQLILQILSEPLARTNVNGRWRENKYLIYKMLQALYARQTVFEQEYKLTVEENGVGFNGYDSGFLSDVAEKSKAYQNLTNAQAAAVAKRLKKYSGQLEAIAAEKLQLPLPLVKPAPKEIVRKEVIQERLFVEYPD